ncbi:MAG: DUF411 domain-containing protein [Candidatus Paceibacterota bacterium]
MNNKTLFIVLFFVLAGIGVVGLTVIPSGSSDSRLTSHNNDIVATVYKSPTCGCCGVYVSYLKRKDYNVKTENIQDMVAIKQKLGIPFELGSCHTMKIGGYVVEGHIPEEAVQKLLAEKPDIKGIGLSGMPAGSPGMPGPKTEDFVIYEINHEGTKGDIFMTI